MGPGFQGVIDSFGRPVIESWLPLDWRRGPATQARVLDRESYDIDPQADRTQLLAEEQQRNQAIAADPETFAVFVALDLQVWRLLRFTLSSGASVPAHGVEHYEVLYLAQPGLKAVAA